MSGPSPTPSSPGASSTCSSPGRRGPLHIDVHQVEDALLGEQLFPELLHPVLRPTGDDPQDLQTLADACSSALLHLRVNQPEPQVLRALSDACTATLRHLGVTQPEPQVLQVPSTLHQVRLRTPAPSKQAPTPPAPSPGAPLSPRILTPAPTNLLQVLHVSPPAPAQNPSTPCATTWSTSTSRVPHVVEHQRKAPASNAPTSCGITGTRKGLHGAQQMGLSEPHLPHQLHQVAQPVHQVPSKQAAGIPAIPTNCNPFSSASAPMDHILTQGKGSVHQPQAATTTTTSDIESVSQLQQLLNQLINSKNPHHKSDPYGRGSKARNGRTPRSSSPPPSGCAAKRPYHLRTG